MTAVYNLNVSAIANFYMLSCAVIKFFENIIIQERSILNQSSLCVAVPTLG